jgi:hypothetical protein
MRLNIFCRDAAHLEFDMDRLVNGPATSQPAGPHDSPHSPPCAARAKECALARRRSPLSLMSGQRALPRGTLWRTAVWRMY